MGLKFFRTLINERGSVFIEYALWIALFVLVIAVAVNQLAGATTDIIQNMINKIRAD
jgi:Flp pilus assembly pilin Flp